MVQVDVDQCIALCDTPGQLCANGDICWLTGYPDMQAGCFPGGTTAVGASCTYAPECVHGAVCSLLNSASIGTCMRVSCDACLPRGAACGHGDCATGPCVCARADCSDDGLGTCVDACTLPPSANLGLCADGAVCARFTDGTLGCLPGGSVALDGSCTVDTDCVRGGVCDGAGHCIQACNTSADCGSGHCANGLCS
jgi:hypothetical protein